jgi:hypothetical protein
MTPGTDFDIKLGRSTTMTKEKALCPINFR